VGEYATPYTFCASTRSSPVTKESLRVHLLFARGLYALGEKDEGEFLISRIADVAPEAAIELEAEIARGALSVSHHPTRRLDAPVAAGFVPGRTSGTHTPAPPAAAVPEPPSGSPAPAPAEALGTGAPAAPTVVRQGSASFAAPRPAMATGGQGHSSAASPTMHRATPAYGSPSYPASSTPGSGSFPPLGVNVNARARHLCRRWPAPRRPLRAGRGARPGRRERSQGPRSQAGPLRRAQDPAVAAPG
jgi:hypothetical protein